MYFRIIFSTLQLCLKKNDSNAVFLFLILWSVGLSWCALMYLGCCVLKVVCFLLNENISRTHMELDVFPFRNTFNIFECFLIGKKKLKNSLIWYFLLVLEIQKIFYWKKAEELLATVLQKWEQHFISFQAIPNFSWLYTNCSECSLWLSSARVFQFISLPHSTCSFFYSVH